MKTFRECYEAVTGLPADQPGKSHIKINPARHGDTTVNMSVGSGYRVTKDGHEPKHTLDPHVAAIALFWRRRRPEVNPPMHPGRVRHRTPSLCRVLGQPTTSLVQSAHQARRSLSGLPH